MPTLETDSDKEQSTAEENASSDKGRHTRDSWLSPLHAIRVITPAGPTDFDVDDISHDSVGRKAYGLCSIPSLWVPPFFLVSAYCLRAIRCDETIGSWIMECLTNSGIPSGSLVMVRSSGTSETLEFRGQLASETCPQDQVVTTIRKLMLRVPEEYQGSVHWIVQQESRPGEKGLLSNERRLSREKRDWVVEFEPQGNRPGDTRPIAVRNWRDGTELPNLNLSCASRMMITSRLKQVAMWATRLSSRTLFEWVWDGRAVQVVQVDEAEQETGEDPSSLLPTHIHPVAVKSLNVFHQANREDFDRYRKLGNARLYQELGYAMPDFYVMQDQALISRVLSGEIPGELEADLNELTKSPLIIRTDGTNIAQEQSEMLPRSDELRSAQQAIDWLLVKFRSAVEQGRLQTCGLCLIGHHFIPSVASAWARAEPGNRLVRVESLWGIPEGLYWYSHDTFEVDTLRTEIDNEVLPSRLQYGLSEHLRYKGTFVGPDQDGSWRPFETSKPHDWRRSIRDKSWLSEIAHTTRRVAESEMYPVTVMWFIDNHPDATPHEVLPWFHTKSPLGNPKAAPRHKQRTARDFRIESVRDWEQLRLDLQSRKNIDRVVVEPIDPELIRNGEFAKNLAGLARSNEFVIELAGGILSHVFHILQNGGAQVECVDLFGADEDVVEYDKLVRDKIPDYIEKRGERVEILRLRGDALIAALKEKLIEEAFEVFDAKWPDELIGELADVQEVMQALCRALEVNASDVEKERAKKETRRGGFEKGLMLIKTSTPHSIRKQEFAPDPPSLGLKLEPSDPVVSNEALLPVKPSYRRSDLRQAEQQLEKLFTLESEIVKLGPLKQTLSFNMPIDIDQQREFLLTVEISRSRSSLRGIVRLTLRAMQLPLPLF